MFGPIEGYEFPDDKTLVVKLSVPHGPLLLAATTPRQLPIMPKHVYGDAEDFMNQDAHKNPVGSGPFIISDRKTDEYVSIVRNENHFVEGLPYLDKHHLPERRRQDRQADRACAVTSSNWPVPTPSCASAISRSSRRSSTCQPDRVSRAFRAAPSCWSSTTETRAVEQQGRPPGDRLCGRTARTYLGCLHGGYTKQSRSPLPATNVFFNEQLQGYPLRYRQGQCKLLDEAGFTPRTATGSDSS